MSISVEIEGELARLSAIQADLCSSLGPEYEGEVADVSIAIDGHEDPDGELMSIANRLRKRYLRSMGAKTSGEWRTPDTGRSRAFPGHPSSFRHAYDRSHAAQPLADRVQFIGEAAKTRLTGATVCSSGMAAINLAIQSLAHTLRREDLKIGVFASYFETHTLLRLSSVANRWTWLRSEADLFVSLESGLFNVIFLETVQWGWNLSALNWGKLVDALNRLPSPPVVVLDTTLTGSSQQTLDTIRLLLGSNAPAVIRVRSCLKLDQQGLELGNLGAVSWGIRYDAKQEYLRFPSVIDACRVVLGAGVGWHESCVFAPRFVAGEADSLTYSELIMRANRRFYSTVPLGGALFKEPVFPKPPWNAPFVLYVLQSETDKCYERLALLIHNEVQRRGIGVTMSGSFGFRVVRYETFVLNEQKRAGEEPGGALKVACGAYIGLAFWKLTALLGELSSFDSLHDAERYFGRSTFGPMSA